MDTSSSSRNEDESDEELDVAIDMARAELTELTDKGHRIRKHRNDEIMKIEKARESFDREWKLWKEKGSTSTYHVSKDEYVATIRKVFAEGPDGDLSSHLTWWCKEESKLLRTMHHFFISKNQCEIVVQYHHDMEESLRKVLSDLREDQSFIESQLQSTMSKARGIQREMEETYTAYIALQVQIMNAYKDKQYATSRSRARFVPDAEQLQQYSSNRRSRARLGHAPTNNRSSRVTMKRRKDPARTTRPNRQESMQRTDASNQKSAVNESILWARNPVNNGITLTKSSKAVRPSRQGSVQRAESTQQKVDVNESSQCSTKPSSNISIDSNEMITENPATAMEFGASRRSTSRKLPNKNNISPGKGGRRKRIPLSKNSNATEWQWERVPSNRNLLKPVSVECAGIGANKDDSIGTSASGDCVSASTDEVASKQRQKESKLESIPEQANGGLPVPKSSKSMTKTEEGDCAGKHRRRVPSRRSPPGIPKKKRQGGQRNGKASMEDNKEKIQSLQWQRIPSTRQLDISTANARVGHSEKDGQSSKPPRKVADSTNSSSKHQQKSLELASETDVGCRKASKVDPGSPRAAPGTIGTSSTDGTERRKTTRSRSKTSRRPTNKSRAVSSDVMIQWQRLPSQRKLIPSGRVRSKSPPRTSADTAATSYPDLLYGKRVLHQTSCSQESLRENADMKGTTVVNKVENSIEADSVDETPSKSAASDGRNNISGKNGTFGSSDGKAHKKQQKKTGQLEMLSAFEWRRMPSKRILEANNGRIGHLDGSIQVASSTEYDALMASESKAPSDFSNSNPQSSSELQDEANIESVTVAKSISNVSFNGEKPVMAEEAEAQEPRKHPSATATMSVLSDVHLAATSRRRESKALRTTPRRRHAGQRRGEIASSSPQAKVASAGDFEWRRVPSQRKLGNSTGSELTKMLPDDSTTPADHESMSKERSRQTTTSGGRRGTGRLSATQSSSRRRNSGGPHRRIGRSKSHSEVSPTSNTKARATSSSILAPLLDEGAGVRRKDRENPVRGVGRCRSHSEVDVLDTDTSESPKSSLGQSRVRNSRIPSNQAKNGVPRPSRRRSVVDNGLSDEGSPAMDTSNKAREDIVGSS